MYMYTCNGSDKFTLDTLSTRILVFDDNIIMIIFRQ